MFRYFFLIRSPDILIRVVLGLQLRAYFKANEPKQRQSALYLNFKMNLLWNAPQFFFFEYVQIKYTENITVSDFCAKSEDREILYIFVFVYFYLFLLCCILFVVINYLIWTIWLVLTRYIWLLSIWNLIFLVHSILCINGIFNNVYYAVMIYTWREKKKIGARIKKNKKY